MYSSRAETGGGSSTAHGLCRAHQGAKGEMIERLLLWREGAELLGENTDWHRCFCLAAELKPQQLIIRHPFESFQNKKKMYLEEKYVRIRSSQGTRDYWAQDYDKVLCGFLLYSSYTSHLSSSLFLKYICRRCDCLGSQEGDVSLCFTEKCILVFYFLKVWKNVSLIPKSPFGKGR